MSITVYTKADCVQCDATTRTLDKAGLAYEVVDLTADADALEYVRTLGHCQAPVIVTDTDNWAGHRPDRIKALAPTAARSPERTQFLVDVLSTAVETGIGYWAEVVHVADQTGTTPAGDNLDPLGSGGDCYTATVREYETGDEHHVNLDTIVRGASLLAKSSIDNDLVNDFREANRTNGDRGDIDASNADMALQMGIFGDVIYG